MKTDFVFLSKRMFISDLSGYLLWNNLSEFLAWMIYGNIPPCGIAMEITNSFEFLRKANVVLCAVTIHVMSLP